jgi:hypothetical protein
MTDPWNETERLPQTAALRRNFLMKTPAQRRMDRLRAASRAARPWIVVVLAGASMGFGGVLVATKAEVLVRAAAHELHEDQRRHAEQNHVQQTRMQGFWASQRRS